MLKRLLATCAGALLAAGVTAAVQAQTPPTPGAPGAPRDNSPTAEITVTSGPGGVTIYISIHDALPGAPGSPGSGGSAPPGAGPSCTAAAVNIGNASLAWIREGLAAHPDTVPWMVRCDNGFTDVAWIPTGAADPPAVVVGNPPVAAVDPVAVAAEVLGIVPLPPIRVGANPGTGLVALPSWFWIDGYDGRRLSGSRAVGLVVVEVEIWPQNYHWSFGDGASLDTLSVGRAYPEESDVRHTYERSSLGAGGAFDTRLEIAFAAQFRVNGGPWTPLPPVVQSYSRAYPVQQLQSVLTGR